MASQIRKVAVLGSGVMGSGIAAHLANAGYPVLLLDIVPPQLSDEDRKRGLTEDSPAFRNRIVQKGFEAATKARPASFFNGAHQKLVTLGNFEDDWDQLAECDWIVEAVVERLDIKQQVFARLEKIWSEGTIVSSNTSGLSLAAMIEGRSLPFRQHFLITHFFNPVRYMRLLELVPGPDTLPEIVHEIAEFGQFRLGKGIVYAKDTPNFVANRLGVYGIAATLGAMTEMDYQIDEVDAITGPALGRPKSATFGTSDLVGLDTLLHTFRTSREGCPGDEGQPYYTAPEFVQKMVEAGALGRKTGAGFFRMERGPGGAKNLLVLDWKTGQYRPETRPDIPSLKTVRKIQDAGERIRTLAAADDRGGRFAWRLLRDTLVYASRRVGEISDTLVDIDRAMRWGYNWELGPFETWDALGVAETVERMKADGIEPAEWVETMLAGGAESFYRQGEDGPEVWNPTAGAYEPVPRPESFLVLDELATGDGVVWKNSGARLIDLGDGAACLELTSASQPAMNPLDDTMIEGILEALERAETEFDALVVHHQGENFSAGANLMGVMQLAAAKNWDAIEAMVRSFQHATTSLRAASIPVVTAPFGYALGGGAELSMGGDRMVAHAETYMGLVEVGVGLVPAGGGTLFLLERLLAGLDEPVTDNQDFVKRAFQTIAMAKVSTSAAEARDLGFLTAADFVEMNRDRQLWSAKRLALTLADLGYRPPLAKSFQLPGEKGAAALRMTLHNLNITHWISDHDQVVAGHVARILTGGDTTIDRPVSAQAILDLEREAFLSLCGEPKTQERIEHMLKTGKPLRN
ncbi:MAG: enoyl-CoA hydratase/isomerase family protein [Acidobacteria bacterium]|nr:enoyl-CoA hydratase/isomerase family protein [Acidobacteriota bacterium]